jgi:hypothetical protein
MDQDLQEQISDLKSLLRTVANSLERHLRNAGEVEEADRVRERHMEHHQYRTARLDRLCVEARATINKASDCEGGPHIESLEDRQGWHLPGRKGKE